LWHIDIRNSAVQENKFSDVAAPPRHPRTRQEMSLFRTLDAFLGWFGYSPAVLLNITAPRWGYRVKRALHYGPEARHRMDLYLPERNARAAVLFFYGGAWISGHRREYRFVGQALASRGIIAGIADYGLFPDHRFPDFVEDGAKAFVFLRQILPEHGGDPARLFVAGHSAGAYIAVMLACDPRYLRDAGDDVSSLAGAIGIAGPYDFLPITHAQRIEIFGGSNRVETQPIHVVDGKRPPMLLLTGDRDVNVLPRNTRNLAARLRQHGSAVEEIIYEGTDHFRIILALAPLFRSMIPIRADIVRFVSAATAPASPAVHPRRELPASPT
jgi:acetyl esterase/lipase